jgi:hypothetical protein
VGAEKKFLVNEMYVLGPGSRLTNIGLSFSGEEPHERALTAPILANKSKNPTRFRFKRDPVDGSC